MNSKEIIFLNAREQCTCQLNLTRVIVFCSLNWLRYFFSSLEVIISAETATLLTVGHNKCSLLTEKGNKRSRPRIIF